MEIGVFTKPSLSENEKGGRQAAEPSDMFLILFFMLRIARSHKVASRKAARSC